MMQNEDDLAIQCARDQAPGDMIATPVEVTEATLLKKMNVTGDDLVVHGWRWYVDLTLRNVNLDSDEFGTEAGALYRVWREAGQFKAVLVELYEREGSKENVPDGKQYS